MPVRIGSISNAAGLADLLPARRGLLLSLLASAALFAVLSFVPGTRQGAIFPYDELCDYRMFMLPTMESKVHYEPTAAKARDACYPPIAYIAARALVKDQGRKWSLSCGEKRLVVSIFAMQLLGAVLLVCGLPGFWTRLATAVVIIMSPACICSVLRGNPSGWAFALACVFLCWYESESRAKRIAAALALGAATALKITPCIFGLLYIADAASGTRRIPWREILVAALSAVILIFVPFLFFGGIDSIPQWISNAFANARFYSVDEPLWGLAALANRVLYSKDVTHSCIRNFAVATRLIAAALVALSVFARSYYVRLLFVGAAMAFLTHHDYGGAYLIPAFVAWLCDKRSECSGVKSLLESVAWFMILAPLQIPNPFFDGSLNAMLQNESLFMLLVLSRFDKGAFRHARLHNVFVPARSGGTGATGESGKSGVVAKGGLP